MSFSFAHPWLLLLLLLLPLLAWLKGKRDTQPAFLYSSVQLVRGLTGQVQSSAGAWLRALRWLALAAFFIALSAYLAWRYRPPPRDWPARLHAVVVRRLRKRGLEPGLAEGPVAFIERAERDCPDLARTLADIRRLYAALRYGPAPRAGDLQRLKHAVNTLQP